MGKINNIENEIRSLSPEELKEFRKWFSEYDANAWDQQIEADILGGRLEKLASEALDSHKNGKSTKL